MRDKVSKRQEKNIKLRRIQDGNDEVILHGEIGELGKKRGRTEINVMLKEETCNHQENKRKKKIDISAKEKV